MAATESRAPLTVAAGQPPSLWIGDLSPDVNEAILFTAFQRFGSVASVRVCRDAITRKSLGYAYVNFSSVAEAAAALKELNYTPLPGSTAPMRIMWVQRDPTARRAAVGNVVVKNLPPSIDAKTINDLFGAFGVVQSVRLSTDAQGKGRGYGFVQFDTEAAARKCISDLNGMELEGRTISIEAYVRFQDRHKSGEWTNCYVKNVPPTWPDEKLRALFAEHGEVASCVIMRGPDGASRGFGFVNYRQKGAAEKAVAALNDLTVEDIVVAPSPAPAPAPAPAAAAAAETATTASADAATAASAATPSVTEAAALATSASAATAEGSAAAAAPAPAAEEAPIAASADAPAPAAASGDAVASAAVPPTQAPEPSAAAASGEAGAGAAAGAPEAASATKPTDAADASSAPAPAAAAASEPAASVEKADGGKAAEAAASSLAPVAPVPASAPAAAAAPKPPTTYKLFVARHQTKSERAKELSRKLKEAKGGSGAHGGGDAGGAAAASANLYVKNLAAEIGDDELRSKFTSFGTVTSAKVMKEATTGASRGFGFVCFSAHDDAARAQAELHKALWHGRPLYVALAQAKDEREEQLRLARAEAQQAAAPRVAGVHSGYRPGGGGGWQGGGGAGGGTAAAAGGPGAGLFPAGAVLSGGPPSHHAALAQQQAQQQWAAGGGQAAQQQAAVAQQAQQQQQQAAQASVMQMMAAYQQHYVAILQQVQAGLLPMAQAQQQIAMMQAAVQAQMQAAGMQQAPAGQQQQQRPPQQQQQQQPLQQVQQLQGGQGFPGAAAGAAAAGARPAQAPGGVRTAAGPPTAAVPAPSGAGGGGAGGAAGGLPPATSFAAAASRGPGQAAGGTGGPPAGGSLIPPGIRQMQQQHQQQQQQAARPAAGGPVAPPGVALRPGVVQGGAAVAPPGAGAGRGAAAPGPAAAGAAAGAGQGAAGDVAALRVLLERAPPDQHRNILGQALYSRIAKLQPARAPKITGMLLETGAAEVLAILGAPGALERKVAEAIQVLADAQQ